jgi:hypothetical protein
MPRRRSTGRNVVVERIIEKSSMTIIYPTLTCSNYSEWSLVMQVNMQADRFLDAIELGTDDYREDRSALAALFCAMPKEMQSGLTHKESVADAWEAIRVVRMGGNHILEAKVDKLHHDFGDLHFKARECVVDFSLHISAITN